MMAAPDPAAAWVLWGLYLMGGVGVALGVVGTLAVQRWACWLRKEPEEAHDFDARS